MNIPDPFDTRLRNALRELPHGQPPADFARAVVEMAERRARRVETSRHAVRNARS